MQKKKTKGRGYIENSMSVNAQIAHRNGLKPISQFSSKELTELGFDYPYVFFKWLVKKNYIRPEEIHHTSAVKNRTKFYGKTTINYLTQNYNLDLLYQMYRGKLTLHEAKKERGITYVKVKTLDTLFGIHKGYTLTLNCIKCDNIIFYTSKFCFRIEPGVSYIIEEFTECPENFANNNLHKISDQLVRRKTNSFFKYLKNKKENSRIIR